MWIDELRTHNTTLHSALIERHALILDASACAESLLVDVNETERSLEQEWVRMRPDAPYAWIEATLTITNMGADTLAAVYHNIPIEQSVELNQMQETMVKNGVPGITTYAAWRAVEELGVAFSALSNEGELLDPFSYTGIATTLTAHLRGLVPASLAITQYLMRDPDTGKPGMIGGGFIAFDAAGVPMAAITPDEEGNRARTLILPAQASEHDLMKNPIEAFMQDEVRLTFAVEAHSFVCSTLRGIHSGDAALSPRTPRAPRKGPQKSITPTPHLVARPLKKPVEVSDAAAD